MAASSHASVPPLGDPGLEDRVQELQAAVARLEARVARLEGRPAPAPLPLLAAGPAAPAAPVQPVEEAHGLVSVLGLLGRVCLILGGAFFFRSLTDTGAVPHGVGVGLGLAYAIVWAVAARRSAQSLPATFYALASVLITYPLVWESTTTFATFRPSVAAGLIFAVACLHVGLAWARSLKVVAWSAAFTALATSAGLMVATQAIEPFTVLFLAFGAASLWLTYGRRWHALRWPAALSADFAVLVMALLAAWPGGPPEGYRGLSANRAIALALTLVALYVGSFAARMRQRQRTLNGFEVIQTALVVLVGFGGALRVAAVAGSGAGLIATGVLGAGLGSYAAAFPFAREREDLRTNFSFFTSLAAVFLLIGGSVLLPPAAFALAGSILGLASTLVGLRLHRTTLLLQGAVFLVTAAASSGLVFSSLLAFLGTAPKPGLPPAQALAVLVALAIAHGMLVAQRPAENLGWRFRTPSFLAGTLAVLGLGALVLWGCLRLAPASVTDAGLRAAFRTGVVSAAAIALAAVARRIPGTELRWLVYPLLGLAALKFILEDFSLGRPLTLFPTSMVFGAALILAPRFMKAARIAVPPAPEAR